MAEKTKIQWCDDTHNFWQGCTKVSDGCKNCYAEARDKRFTGGKLWGKNAARQRSSSFNKPLTWNKKPWVCETCGGVSDRLYDHSCTGKKEDARHTANVKWHRRRVFSLSLGDWLDDEVQIEWLADMLKVIHDCPNLDFLLLTKRPENWHERIFDVMSFESDASRAGKDYDNNLFNWCYHWIAKLQPPKNIWLGVSVENQATAVTRIPELLKIPAKVRFLSCEPLLGEVDLMKAIPDRNQRSLSRADGEGVDWVIVGGESGPGARPCNVEWIRSIKDQCRAAGVACFVKQLGAKVIACNGSVFPVDLKDKKGGDISEWPEDLRVREFPAVTDRTLHK